MFWLQIQQLYRIEQIADQEELTYEQRMLRRQEQALPMRQLENGWKQPIRSASKSRMGQSYRLRVSTLATYEELSERRQA